MSINSFYYKEFVDCIIKIFKNYNKEKYINELNINKDLSLLNSVFLEPINYIKEHYLSWDDQLWVESTKYIKLGLLSFLYKNKASLYKIYTLVENNHVNQCILLEKYKNLFKDLMANKNLSSIQNYIIQENIELDEIEKKKYYLILNIKNIKNPKFVAYLFDIITYKTFRKNIFKYLLNNIKKINPDNNATNGINIDEITKIENDYENIFIKDFDKLIDNGLLYSISNFIMFIDFGKNKQICVHKHIQEKVNDYIKDVLEKSSKMHIYLDKLINKNKNAEKIFKSDTSLVIISEDVSSKTELNYYLNTKTNKFEEAYRNSNNIILEEIDFDAAYDEVFNKKNLIKYNKRDFITRITNIIYLLIEYIAVLPKNDIKTKLEKVNLLIQNGFKTFFNSNEEENNQELIIDIKKNGIFTNSSEYINKEETLIEINKYIDNILNELSKNPETTQEHVLYIKKLFEDCINKLRIYKDITNINDFNVFSELIEKIIENKYTFKLLILEILQEKHILNFINIIEKITLFKLNNLCKVKVVELLLNFIQQIIQFININNEKEYLNNTKILIFLGKLLDKFYIIAKNFSEVPEDSSRNVKRIIKYNTIKK